MSFIISETGSVVIILPYVRDAVKSAETHTPHPQSARTLHPVCLRAWQIQNTVTTVCVGVQWTYRLGETFPLHGCLLNDVCVGLWWRTSEFPPPKVGKPITNYAAGFCSLICRRSFFSKYKVRLQGRPFSTTTTTLSGGGGRNSQNCVFIIKIHYGHGLSDIRKFLWTDWMTKLKIRATRWDLTPTVTGKQITTTVGASCHTEWCYCQQILTRFSQLTLPTFTALMKLG